MSDLNLSLERMAKPFFDQGLEKLYVVRHCNRLFVGRFPAKICRVCGQKPTCLEISSLDDIPKLSASLDSER